MPHLAVVAYALVLSGSLFGQPPADPLPPGAVAQLGSSRFRVDGYRGPVLLTPTGDTIVEIAFGNKVRLWSVETGKVVRQIDDPDLYSTVADLSPDGQFLALFGTDKRGKPAPDTALRLYDLKTGKVVWTTVIDDLPHPPPTSVRFSADGTRLATSSLDVRVWDAKTGRPLATWATRTHPGRIDFSPDGKAVAVTGQVVGLWAWEKEAEPRPITLGQGVWVEAPAFAPDGTAYFVQWGRKAEDFGLVGYDPKTAKETDRVPVHAVRWASVAPDGRTVATGSPMTGGRSPREFGVTLWDRKTGKIVRTLDTGREVADAGSWSADGKRFVARTSGRLWVWEPATGKLLGPADEGHTGMILGLAFTPAGQVVSVGHDNIVRVWDPATGRVERRFDTHSYPGIGVSPDGTLLAVNALSDDFRVYDLKTGAELFKLAGHGQVGGLRLARFSADEQLLVSFGDDGKLRTWDVLTGAKKAEQQYLSDVEQAAGRRSPERPYIQAVDLGPDGNTLVIADQKVVRVIAADTGKERGRFEAGPRLSRLAVSPDGKRVATLGPPAGEKGAEVTVWDLADGTAQVKWRTGRPTTFHILLVSPDGKWVVTGGMTGLDVWDAATGAAVGEFPLPTHAVRAAFDGAGKRLAVGLRDTTILVLDVAKAMKVEGGGKE